MSVFKVTKPKAKLFAPKTDGYEVDHHIINGELIKAITDSDPNSDRDVEVKGMADRLLFLAGTVNDLKEGTGTIDYGCEIKNGRCKAYGQYSWQNTNKMCCSRCYDSFGYLKRPEFFAFSEDIQEYNDKFVMGKGFWRAKGGCSLPRRLRSRACLTYNCCSAGGFNNFIWNISEAITKHGNAVVALNADLYSYVSTMNRFSEIIRKQKEK